MNYIFLPIKILINVIGFRNITLLTLLYTVGLYVASLTLQTGNLSILFGGYFYVLIGTVLTINKQIKKLTLVLEQINTEQFDHRDIHFNGIFPNDLLNKLLSTYKDLGRINNIYEERIKEVEYSAAQVISISSKVKDNVHKQSDATSSTAAAIDELSSSLEAVNNEISSTHESSCAASKISNEGENTLISLNDAVIEVSERAKNTQSRLILLNDLVKQVDKITQSIQQISQQTNLLALNASIEAARAGEMGRGFAVVAEEVRDLATKTSNATDLIVNNISDVLKESTEIINTMNEVIEQTDLSLEKTTLVDNAFKEIYNATDQVKSRMESVSAVSNQQSMATQEIARHIASIVLGAQENANIADQSILVANHLRKLTQAES